MNKYDIAVIGAGPAGYNCAINFAKKGKKVVIIEKDNLGGTCLNRGCIPTKFLWQAASVKQTISKSYEYGLKSSLETISFQEIINKKNKLVENLVKGVSRLLTANKVEIIKGTASFKNKNEINIKTETEWFDENGPIKYSNNDNDVQKHCIDKYAEYNSDTNIIKVNKVTLNL